MCGIIGYIGHQDVTPILISGLKNLEYRGYDSSGVGVLTDDGKITIRKNEGKIANLEELIKRHPISKAHVGISHTRWATHGAPSKRNAHPHADGKQQFAVVHNGIIENYQELKTALKKKGRVFASDTDTEVIVHLIAEHYKGDLFQAVLKTLNQLRGAFALGVVSHDHPDELIAARVGSPLIIGVGKGENYIASDVPAIIDRTRKVIYLDDQQVAILKKDSIAVYDFKGKPVKHKVEQVSFTIGSAQKEGYPHFMLKEIHEQPEVLTQMLKLRVKGRTVELDGIGLSDKKLAGLRNIKVVACGTAYHAGLIGRYVIEKLAGIPVEVDVSSEFRYRSPILDKNTLILAVSQSGETADTLAAVREAKGKGAKVISICNVIGSSLARESDGVLYTHAGPEIGVASTKAYTAQLFMLYLFGLKMADARKHISDKERNHYLDALARIPELYKAVLKKKNSVAKISKYNSHFGCFLYLGRNVNYPSALEGALKLKEISYIPAEGYAAGEMKHGPIALIDEYRAVVCIAPESDIYEKMVSNIQEIRSRKAKVIAIATEGDNVIKHHADHVIYIPHTDPLLTPLLVAIPLQYLAYYVAVNRGCDVDQPRNLAKSVTVE